MKHITVKNIEEFSHLFVPSKRTELSIAVIDLIETNLGNSKSIIKEIHIHIESTQTDIILALNRHEFLDVLEDQLKMFEEIELYEECARIVKIIKSLKTGSILQSLVESKKKNK
jgi:mRNA deadenylase 3'-5' endonuclease subunit Ccr4